MEDIIKTDKLAKHYSEVHAVHDISLSVRKGEIYGFLGLNGAGKTTTIRMLLGMIHPTSGASYLYGKKVDPGNSRLWEKVGYLVEAPYSYPELTVRENLNIMRRLRQITDRNSIDAVIDKLKLTPYRERKAKNLSLGNGQRLGLAKALIHNPDILILDEPSNGLDPAGIVEIRELLLDLAFNRGVTIFLSSHILGEISKLATRIGIVHEGRLLQEVNVNQLDQLRYKCLVIGVNDIEAARKKLNDNGFSVKLNDEGMLETTNKEAITHPDDIACILVRAGIPLTLLKVEEEDLESYFLRTIGMRREEK